MKDIKDKSNFAIRRLGNHFIVDRKITEEYGLFFISTRKVWKPLSILGMPITGNMLPALFKNNKEAIKFIENIKRESEIEYFN